MPTATASFKQLAATSKQVARRLLTIGENRLELLTVEVQEERDRLLHAVLLALGVAGFGLLAGAAFTGALVVLLWAIAATPNVRSIRARVTNRAACSGFDIA